MNITPKRTSARVISLAERVGETLEITELEPRPRKGVPVFIGKSIDHDGSVIQYPSVTWWRQDVAVIPATIIGLFAYLRRARERNVCLIRGAPANLERQPTRRQRAHEIKRGVDRGDHGFVDAPNRLLTVDGDNIEMKWRDDPEAAIKRIVAQMGEPWASASFVWFFSATHGLELDKDKKWTGGISDGKVRVRLMFITDRPLLSNEAVAMINLAKVKVKGFDNASGRVVQINYIRRPLWVGHPDEDVLGDIATLGRVKVKKEFLAIPDDLAHQARWAKAQGHSAEIAEHPDAETAVRSIGSDGDVRAHMMSAVLHLLNANPVPDVTSFYDHSVAIVAQLRGMIIEHREEIDAHLKQHGRPAHTIDGILQHINPSYAEWALNNQGVLRRKTIKLVKEERPEADAAEVKAVIFARVERVIEYAHTGEVNAFKQAGGIPLQVLLVAPPGSRKSTLMRAKAVLYATEHPDKSVVILLPRHKLGAEQIKSLHEEHPNTKIEVAEWHGRLAWNPDVGDGRKEKMCLRPEEAKALQEALIDVEKHLCKQGRGKKAIKCPLFELCGWQKQKLIEANIWFAMHENMVHTMPKAFGDVGWVMIDESPLDAFMFGVNVDDQVTLELDALHKSPVPFQLDEEDAGVLRDGRDLLYQALDSLRVPIEWHKGAPISKKSLGIFEVKDFFRPDALSRNINHLIKLELKGKVDINITPDMTEKQVKYELQLAAGNSKVMKRVLLWKLVEQAIASKDELFGRIQVHRGDEGRIIRMVGLREIAKGWDVRLLICDATGDAD